ncbi:MAG: glycosyltransferase, partial [Chloroflexota bacterium]
KVKEKYDLRVAIVYDNTIRKDTTGELCRRALDKLCSQAHHFLPSQVYAIPSDYHLYINIDDGLNYRLPSYFHPSVYWAIDTHLDYDMRLNKAGHFDLVFAAQKDGAEQLRRDGIHNARWLPLACDPDFHRPVPNLPKVFDIAFVGNVPFSGDERSAYLSLIRRRFPNCFIGNAYFEQMAHVYSQSRIVFNRSVRNDVNMRVFEAIACGSMLVTNDLIDNGQDELFTPGEHCITYKNQLDFIELVDKYLADDKGRERIAWAGKTHAHTCHTYHHRMQQLLEEATASSSQTITRNPVEENRDLAEKLVRSGQWEAAAEKLRLVIQLSPDYAEVYNDLGAVCFLRGHHAEARDCFTRALELKPTYTVAKENLESLLAMLTNTESTAGSSSHYSTPPSKSS